MQLLWTTKLIIKCYWRNVFVCITKTFVYSTASRLTFRSTSTRCINWLGKHVGKWIIAYQIEIFPIATIWSKRWCSTAYFLRSHWDNLCKMSNFQVPIQHKKYLNSNIWIKFNVLTCFRDICLYKTYCNSYIHWTMHQ